MSAVLLIISVVCISLGDICKKVYNNKVHGGKFLYSAISALAAVVFFIITSASPKLSLAPLPYSLGFAAAYSLTNVFLFLAISYGSLSLTSLISSYSLLLPTLYGLIFLDEPLSYGLIIGLVLLIISLSMVGDKSSSTRITLKWMIYVFIAFVGNGMCSIIQKMQQIRFDGAYKNEFMIIALIIVFLVLITIAFIRERNEMLQSLKKGWIFGIAGGATNGIVNLFVMILSGMMPVSVMFPVISCGGIVITYIVSRVLYKEQLSKKQFFGFLLGILSVIILNF